MQHVRTCTYRLNVRELQEFHSQLAFKSDAAILSGPQIEVPIVGGIIGRVHKEAILIHLDSNIY